MSWVCLLGQREMPLCAMRDGGAHGHLGPCEGIAGVHLLFTADHRASSWRPSLAGGWVSNSTSQGPRVLRDTCRVPGHGTVPGEMSFPHWLGSLLTQAVSQAGMYAPWEHLLSKAIILACVLVAQDGTQVTSCSVYVLPGSSRSLAWLSLAA